MKRKREWLCGSASCLAVLGAIWAMAPQAAWAVPQTFWASGAGDFAAHAVEPGGGQAALTGLTAGVVQWKDTSALKDMTYTVSGGEQPRVENGWLTLNVGSAPVDITIDGSDFELKGNATFTGSLHSHGRVRTLGGSGSYGVGDDGSGNPLLKWTYDVQRAKLGLITSDAAIARGSGLVRGDFNTLGKVIALRGRVGGVKFTDLSAAQDMAVSCRGAGAKRTRTNSVGQKVVVCLGAGGRATVSGSNVHWQLRAVRVWVSIPADVAGHLRGRWGAYAHGFFAPDGA